MFTYSKHPRPHEKTPKGFNLIEAAIVLGVVGLVIGVIWVAAAAVTDHFKVAETAAELAKTCNSISRVFPSSLVGSGSSYTDVTNAAIAADLFPASWINGAVITLPVGGTVKLYQWQADYIWNGQHIGGNITFGIEQIPNKYCRQLVPTLIKSGGIAIGAGSDTFNLTRNVERSAGYNGVISDDCGTEPENIIAILCGWQL